MCNCLKEAAVKLEEHLKAKVRPSDVYSYDHIGFDNECIMFGTQGTKGRLSNAVGLPFSIEYHAKKSDGTKSTRATTLKTNLFMTFCPILRQKIS